MRICIAPARDVRSVPSTDISVAGMIADSGRIVDDEAGVVFRPMCSTTLHARAASVHFPPSRLQSHKRKPWSSRDRDLFSEAAAPGVFAFCVGLAYRARLLRGTPTPGLADRVLAGGRLVVSTPALRGERPRCTAFVWQHSRPAPVRSAAQHFRPPSSASRTANMREQMHEGA
jgi:hypothetical protein